MVASTDFQTGGARISALTSGTAGVTTQDITDSNLGITPKGVILIATLAVTNDTVASGASFAYGMTDGVEEISLNSWAEDGVGTTAVGTFSHGARVMHMADDSGTIVLSLSFDSFISQGVRVTYETIPSSAYLIQAIFFGGDTCEIDVDTDLTSATKDADVSYTGPGFEPDALVIITNGLVIQSTEVAGTVTSNNLCTGIASNLTALEQAFYLISHTDSVSTTEGFVSKGKSRITKLGHSTGGGTKVQTSSSELKSFDVNGFTLTTRDLPARTIFAFMAIKTGTPDVEVEVQTYDTGNTTGSQSYSGAPYGVGSAFWLMNEINSGQFENTLGPSSCFGIGYFDANVEFSTSFSSRDNLATSDTGSLSSDVAGRLLSRALSATTGMVCSLTSLDDDGWTVNWASEIGGGKHWYTLAFQKPAELVPGVIGTLEVEPIPPAIVTPLPIVTPLDVLELTSQPVLVETPIVVPADTLEIADQPTFVNTPIPTPLDLLELADVAPTLETPITAPVDILELEGVPPSLVPVVDTPLAVIEADPINPDPVSPVYAVQGVLEAGLIEPDVIAPVESSQGTLIVDPIEPVLGEDIVSPVGVLETNPQVVDPSTPVVFPTATTEVDPVTPDPITPVAVTLDTVEIDPQAVDPTTPVETGLAELELERFIPSVSVGILVPAGTLEAVGIDPSVFTPVEVALGDLQLEGQAVSVGSGIFVFTDTLELLSIDPEAVTPIEAGGVILQLQNIDPDVLGPVGVGLGVLELADLAPSVRVDLILTTALLELAAQDIGILQGVTAVLEAISLDPVSPDPLVPAEAPTANVELGERLPGPVTPIEPPAAALELVPGATEPVLPVSGVFAVLELAQLEPTVETPLSVPSATLVFEEFIPTVDAFLGLEPGCYRRSWLDACGWLFTNVTDANGWPAQFDNYPFVQPEDSLWGRPAVNWKGATETHTGNGLTFRKNGELVVAWFVPIETGYDVISAAADAVVNGFRTKKIQDLRFETPTAKVIGRSGKWWRLDVTCPFSFDVKTETPVSTPGNAMTILALLQAINTRFKTQVTDLQGVPTQVDNFPFTQPEDSVWVRFTVLPGESTQISTPGSEAGTDIRYRTPGIAVASVFVPIEEGTLGSLTLIDQIDEQFKAVTDSGVTYRTPRVVTVGRSGKWHQTNIELPFYADTIA